jgi:hypothetical protein
MSEPDSRIAGRSSGKVLRVLGDYGFVSCDDRPEQDVYFKAIWYTGSPPLTEGESVTFEVKAFGENLQAHRLSRLDENAADRSDQRRDHRVMPEGGRLLDWAYLGYLPRVLTDLRSLALSEEWEFMNTLPSPDRPVPILYSYLLQTFGRLALEGKVLISKDATVAAFNTGLVDPRYEPIFATFAPNDDPRAAWQLSGFCIAGEDIEGQRLVRHFAPLPSPPHYFDSIVDLLYDTRAGKPELDWEHVVIERIDRYPAEFVEDHWPPEFERRDASELSHEDRRAYYRALGTAIAKDTRTYRRIMNRVKDAIDLSIKRVTWNFKTAIPTYYPRVRRLQLLLPICLLSDERVDLALAVEKTPSGNYLGHTVLPLDWAYKNARLVCRPDSDWLAPAEITAEQDEEEDI